VRNAGRDGTFAPRPPGTLRTAYRTGVETAAGHDLAIVGLLAAAAALLVLATLIRVPYPILLVLGGLVVGFVPGVPELELDPELVLVAFLPPLLYVAAFFTSLRDLRRKVRPISLLSVGLVLATMVAVAAIAHAAIDGLPWAAAFALGAIVSPTDPVAATAIARRVGVSRRVVTVVEGEALINDGTALVAYRFAVAAAVTGAFSFWEASANFVLNVVGGVVVGLVLGVVIRALRRRLDHPPTEIAISIMTGYLAFLTADALGVSGVLAAVTVGIYMGWHAPELTTVQLRLQGQAVWEIIVFVLNAVLFGLVGLQLPSIVDSLSGYSATELATYAILVSGAVVLIRLAWVFAFMHVPRVVRAIREGDPAPSWKEPALIGWMGLRGAVSLAAALALPLQTDAGEAFPARDLIIFLTFCVILATLVMQGLSLPPLVRLLRLERDESEEREEVEARLSAAEAALARIEELAEEDWPNPDSVERMRGMYGFRLQRFGSRFGEADDDGVEGRSRAYQRLRRELLEAERAAVVQLRREGRSGSPAA
jgi:monovalent cation/hydrogen antiporter